MDVLNQQAPLFVWPIQLCLGAALTTYVLSLVTGNVSQVDRVWTFLPTLYNRLLCPSPTLAPYPTDVPSSIHPRNSSRVFRGHFQSPSITHARFGRELSVYSLQVGSDAQAFRLSYNTFRRGLFRLNEEDYRWQVLRENIPPWLFQVFNLTFVAVIQNIILMLLGVPAKIAVTQPHTSLGVSDYVLGALGFLTILIEFTADNQQYSYQTFKRSGKLDPNE
ncbi:hypothetical protein EV363DRAFT_1541336, partial [Boletus edulis]